MVIIDDFWVRGGNVVGGSTRDFLACVGGVALR